MPFPFCEDKFLPPANPDDVCAVMRRSLQLHEFVKLMVGYMVDCENGNLPAKDFALEICAQTFVPGMMIPFYATSSDYEDVPEEVKDIWGPPNSFGLAWWELATEMEGRFPLGASTNYSPRSSTGSENETATLTVEQIPEHDHEVIVGQAEGTDADPYAGRFLYSPKESRIQEGIGVSDPSTKEFPELELGMKVGGGKPHNNMPPYRTIVWIRRTNRMQV